MNPPLSPTPSPTTSRNLSRAEVADAATAELHATLAVLTSLTPEEWQAPTDCTGWSVQQLTAHLLGQYQEQANPALLLSRIRRGRRAYPDLPSLAAHNQVQLDDLAAQSPDHLTAALTAAGPRGVRACRRMPWPVRRLDSRWIFRDEVLVDQHLSYIFDVLTLRDPWMHRLDICAATGHPILPYDHHALVVDGVMHELATQWHGPAVRVRLHGNASGSWSLASVPDTGTTPPDVELPALDFMRSLSGRPVPPDTWPQDGDPDVVTALTSARIVF